MTADEKAQVLELARSLDIRDGPCRVCAGKRVYHDGYGNSGPCPFCGNRALQALVARHCPEALAEPEEKP